jgi:hypothetical protein
MHGQPVGRKGLGAILKTGLLLAHASWIAGGAKHARRAGATAQPRKARFFAKQKMRSLILGKTLG